MKLIIPDAIEKRIHAYVMSVDSEIAGMGKVRMEGGNIIVEDIMIVEQEVTGTTADLDQAAMAKWMGELIARGESPKAWKLWWHSHANMGAFFSVRDTNTMDRHNESDWLVSLVVNKRREREARVDLYRPFRTSLEDIAIEIAGTEAFIVPQEIRDEVRAKVRAAKVYASKAPMGYKTPATPSPYHDPYWDEREEERANAESGYTREQQIATIKILEAQREEARKKHGEDSEQYDDVCAELADWYYSLSYMEKDTDPLLSRELEEKAEVIEEERWGTKDFPV